MNMHQMDMCMRTCVRTARQKGRAGNRQAQRLAVIAVRFRLLIPGPLAHTPSWPCLQRLTHIQGSIAATLSVGLWGNPDLLID